MGYIVIIQPCGNIVLKIISSGIIIVNLTIYSV